MSSRNRLVATPVAPTGAARGTALARRVRWLWAGAIVGLGLAALITAVYAFDAVSRTVPGAAPAPAPTPSVADRKESATPEPDVSAEPGVDRSKLLRSAALEYSARASDAAAEWASVSVAAVSAAGGMMSGVAAVVTTRRSRLPAPAPAPAEPASSDTPAASGPPSRAVCRREPSSPRLQQPGRRRRRRPFRHPEPPR